MLSIADIEQIVNDHDNTVINVHVCLELSIGSKTCYNTCESGLVAGTVSYQPEPLERPADGTLLICCSQPRDEVILDL